MGIVLGIIVVKFQKNWSNRTLIILKKKNLGLQGGNLQQIQKQHIPIPIMVERGKINILNIRIHDHSLSWLDTGTSIKSGRVELVL
jgi:hypothetical protein